MSHGGKIEIKYDKLIWFHVVRNEVSVFLGFDWRRGTSGVFGTAERNVESRKKLKFGLKRK